MNKHVFKRGVSMLLALVLALAAVPVTGLAAETEFTMIELKGTDVTLDETVFEYTGSEIKPNVTVRVEDRLLTLDKDYTLEYANNIEVGTGKVIVKGIATAAPSYGYTGTVEIPFQIKAKNDATQPPEFTLVEIKGTDVTIEGTEFPYTGSPIEPKITVTVDGKVLTAGRDYNLTYQNNTQVGTATAVVTGIATASETLGYTGTVKIDFTIRQTEPEFTLVEIKGTDVTIEGTEFVYTGSYIEPKITVTVDGKVLTAGKDYNLRYHNNIGVGTATAVVTGIETASETVGYTGEVNINFTIVKDPQTPEYQLITLKGTDVTIDGKEFVYTGKAIEPKITVTVNGKVLTLGTDYSLVYKNNIQPGTATAVVTGIATASETLGYTGTVEVTFTITKAAEAPEEVEYKITKGNKVKWYQESSKTLSFTADGKYADFEGVLIDGKDLPEKYYTVKEGSTVVTLKNSFLKKLGLGNHTITIQFTDGEAEGTFKVAEGLDPTNPETGDAFSLSLHLSVMGISLAAAAGLIAFGKKRFA